MFFLRSDMNNKEKKIYFGPARNWTLYVSVVSWVKLNIFLYNLKYKYAVSRIAITIFRIIGAYCTFERTIHYIIDEISLINEIIICHDCISWLDFSRIEKSNNNKPNININVNIVNFIYSNTNLYFCISYISFSNLWLTF